LRLESGVHDPAEAGPTERGDQCQLNQTPLFREDGHVMRGEQRPQRGSAHDDRAQCVCASRVTLPTSEVSSSQHDGRGKCADDHACEQQLRPRTSTRQEPVSAFIRGCTNGRDVEVHGPPGQGCTDDSKLVRSWRLVLPPDEPVVVWHRRYDAGLSPSKLSAVEARLREQPGPVRHRGREGVSGDFGSRLLEVNQVTSRIENHVRHAGDVGGRIGLGDHMKGILGHQVLDARGYGFYRLPRSVSVCATRVLAVKSLAAPPQSTDTRPKEEACEQRPAVRA